jgi:hypothetical protein
LIKRCGFDATAAVELFPIWIANEHTGAALPHHHHILVEHVQSGQTGTECDEQPDHSHTGWGGRVNRPRTCIVGGLGAYAGEIPELHVDNNAV